MSKNERTSTGRPRLQRDNQQWIFDYLVKETGKVFHWWTDEPGELPKSVKSHAMISKHVGRQGRQLETLAETEIAAGHRHTALEIAFAAARKYMMAQHTIFEVNDEKRFLYAGLQRCFERVRELAPYRIEQIDIPWNGTTVSGSLHLLPGEPTAPVLFYVPGCDVTRESWPNPAANLGHQRGMHVFSFDGPGQGSSNMRGIKLTADNYELAAAAALDHLAARPEIDAERMVAYGTGFGGFWVLRIAAHDRRLKAVATSSSYSPMYYLATEDSPRYKQLFAFLTQAPSEDELDGVLDAMTLEGYVERIGCPTLMCTGEYDHRDPLEEVYRTFDRVGAPAELWMFADAFHKLKLGPGGTVHALMLDWLRDRLDGQPVPHPGEVLYLEAGSAGPNSPKVSRRRTSFEPTTSP